MTTMSLFSIQRFFFGGRITYKHLDMIYLTSLVFCIINEIERITVIGNKDWGNEYIQLNNSTIVDTYFNIMVRKPKYFS